jgi:hypothetical protein
MKKNDFVFFFYAGMRVHPLLQKSPARESHCSYPRRRLCSPGATQLRPGAATAPLLDPSGAYCSVPPAARPVLLLRVLCSPGLICAICSSSILEGNALVPPQPQAESSNFFQKSGLLCFLRREVLGFERVSA